MKKVSLIAILTSLIIMLMSAYCFAGEGDLKLQSSYPEDGQKNTSMENLGVKLNFDHPINTKEAKKANKDKLVIVDEDGKKVPIQILYSDKNDGLVVVVADQAQGFTAKNNSEYKLVIDPAFTDNDGNTFGKEQTISFKTYNQKVNNMVNMAMMMVMFGGITVISMRQNNQNEDEENKKEEPKEAFNPYKEAKKTGKSVEEVMEEQAKKEEKKAKKKARKKKKTEENPEHKKIDNCAQYLNNVYHVHAPAPISKEDRSVEALRAMRKENKTKKSKAKK